MFLMISVAALCGVLLIALLLRVACRYRTDLWFTKDDVILCFVAPAVILLGAFAGLSIGYRLEHGGLGEVAVGGWIGSVVIGALAYGIWTVLSRRIRESGSATTTSKLNA